jgi:uncharacterized zinc-type alcohol dehydrogenase-like protein
MTQVKAYAAIKAKDSLKPYSIERRNPGEHDIEIDIKFSGVCHSDIHQARAEWGGGIFPMVPGHEIAGIVKSVGAKVTKYKVGDRVGVGCMIDSCRTCEPCKHELQQYCEAGSNYTYNSLEKDGKTPTYGGYSTAIVVDEKFVLRIPDNIPLEKAAPLLCAGITTYSPLMHWNVKPGDKVAVVGLGGLGHMAVKLAAAIGAEVSVLSTSSSKEKDALAFGAKHFINVSDPAVFKKYANYFSFILNTASGNTDLTQYLTLLKLDGSMVLVGAPEKNSDVNAFALLRNRRSLSGSGIGGIQETQEMLDFCGKHNVTPEIEIIPMDKINEAYERMLKSDVKYRFVIDISSLQ